ELPKEIDGGKTFKISLYAKSNGKYVRDCEVLINFSSMVLPKTIYGTTDENGYFGSIFLSEKAKNSIDVTVYVRLKQTGYAPVYGEYKLHINSTIFMVFFIVHDKNGFLENATITVNGKSLMTDKNGTALFLLQYGNYNITATKEGYKKNLSKISIEDDVNIDVFLFEIEKKKKLEDKISDQPYVIIILIIVCILFYFLTRKR
ncbi:MAG: hypothetical protein AB1779_07365, partial [Candidatus Thermoplasmatota archaeon]